MKTDLSVTSKSQRIEIYLSIISDIEFLQPFKEDPDIFNSETDKFKKFLIQAFCYLHPDFHYLSFLNNEDLDLEIIKVAGILQIFPTNTVSTEKRCKLFDGMSESDIHKFWLKFFSLFKKQNDFTMDSIFNINCVNKINFFKEMRNTLNYLNYQFPIVNENKFNDFNITAELNNWKKLINATEITHDESVYFNSDENQSDVNVKNLITDLQQIVTMHNNKKLISLEKKSRYTDFLTLFTSLSENILHFKNNLIIVNSKFLNEHECKLLTNNENISEYIYFIKRCNNTAKALKSEVKSF